MTPRQKAEHLKYVFGSINDWNEKRARECALFVVNEMIDEGANQYGKDAVHNGREQYWLEVKAELEKWN